MKIKHLVAACAATLGLAHAGVLDTRLSYDSVSKEYTQRVLVYNGWSNGVAGFIDIPFALTQTRYSGDINSFRNSNFIEISGWWTKPLNDQFYLRPGMNFLVGPSGSFTRPSITVGYKPSPTLEMNARYRYGHRNYESLDLAKVSDKDHAHLVTLWAGWKYSANLEFEYQLDYIHKINNFVADNNRKTIVENEFQVNFTNAFGKGITPYALIDHLGKSYRTQDGQPKDRWRPRVGIKMVF